MRVALNLHCLHPPLTGIGHYALNLLQQLLDHPAVEEVVGVSHQGWHSRRQLVDLVGRGRGYLPERSVAGQALLRRVPGAGRLRGWLGRCRHRSAGRRHRGFVYWEPNYLLLPLPNPALATVSDLSHLRYPEFHPPERIREMRRLPETLARARALVTVSEFTRSELGSCFDIDPERVGLVPPAVSEQFRPRPPAEQHSVRQYYELPQNYLLHTGAIEPRKNLPRLLAAYCALPRTLQRDFPLVLAGPAGWGMREFEQLYAELPTQSVRRLGYVARKHLPALISGATLLVYPSLYEGFGMPVLEAMACGTPVLTSNLASMPEVAAGAAHLVDPFSQEAITTALQTCLTDSAQRDDMRQRGLTVAAGHSWQRSADLLVAQLQKSPPSPPFRGQALHLTFHHTMGSGLTFDMTAGGRHHLSGVRPYILQFSQIARRLRCLLSNVRPDPGGCGSATHVKCKA